METAASIPSNPRTLEEVFRDYRGRRTAIVRALTTDVDRFYSLCDPGKDNLCLYGYPTESWEVKLPVEELPPELPEPILGINFARDSMKRKDWLCTVAVHSDAWLLAVAFFYGARFNRNERKLLFSMINDLPTVLDIVIEREKEKEKEMTISHNSGRKSKLSGKRKLKNPKLTSMVDKEEKDDTICGICEKTYFPDEFWIQCDTCNTWYHGKCVKVSEAKSKSINLYQCPLCKRKKIRE